MPYFKKNGTNILFIHIPKTGGSSLETYFSAKYQIPLNNRSLFMHIPEEIRKKYNIPIHSSLQHITYSTMVRFNKLFKIDFHDPTLQILTVVRNPYERAISDLFFLNRISLTSSPQEVFKKLQEYTLTASRDLDNHNVPQYLFICDPVAKEKGVIPNIHVMHTETLDEDMGRLGFTDFANGSRAHSSRHSKMDYYQYLNDDSLQLINRVYKDDFTLLGYSMRSSSSLSLSSSCSSSSSKHAKTQIANRSVAVPRIIKPLPPPLNRTLTRRPLPPPPPPPPYRRQTMINQRRPMMSRRFRI